MSTLKIWFTDFWPEWNNENFILPILSKYYDVILDQYNPDVLFHSIFNRMKDTPNYKCKKILYIGENHRPEQFGSNFSISFDPHSDINYRLPLWQVYLILHPELKEKLFSRVNHISFDRFCSFTVSNPDNFIRNGFYNLMLMQSFGKIHSYGKFMPSDFALQQASQGKYWRDVKYEFFQTHKHKYSIAFENNSYPWYTTEKLMDAFLAGSMPLYWGDPKIKLDWNPDAFINVGKLGNDETMNLMRKMETDNTVFQEMYSQPVFTDEQKINHIANIDNFETWLINKI